MKYSVLVAFLFSVSTVNAGLFPTNPEGASILTPNQKVTIQWQDDGDVPSLEELGTIQVDFMTGADLDQTTLDPLGTPTANSGKLDWVVPQVEPAGKFYFLKFSKDSNVYFTTRFTITDINGKYPPEQNPPPAVGKNLGKVGKIIAKGDPNGKVPATTGVDDTLGQTPTDPKSPDDPKAKVGEGETPKQETPKEPTPNEPIPKEPTTNEPIPKEQTPTEPTPKEATPKEETPKEENPNEETPKGKTKSADEPEPKSGNEQETDTSSALPASNTDSVIENGASSINNQIAGGLTGLTFISSLFSIMFI